MLSFLLQQSWDNQSPVQAIALAGSHQTASQLLDDLLIDRAIQAIECSQEEIEQACQQVFQENALETEQERQAWLSQRGFSTAELVLQVERALKIRKFQEQTWNERQLHAHFIERKPQLDSVTFSCIWVQDTEMAQELYFRLANGEQSFEELARQYSQGPEARAGGVVGPIEAGQLPAGVVKQLRNTQPGQVQMPVTFDEQVFILRLEAWHPAQYDFPTQRRLHQELFAQWLQSQREQLGDRLQQAS